MGKGIVKLGEGNWAVKDGNLLAAKETNGRFKNAEFTVTRGTDATYVGKDGLIANETGDNTPRIDFTDNTDGHLLLEPQSTNLVAYSKNLKDGYTKVNSSVDLNDAVAPDGTTTANKFNSTALASKVHKSQQNSSALFHTVSIFLKKGTIDIVSLQVSGASPDINASTTVNLTSGTITASSGNGSITPTITNYGNDWYRITASSTSNGNVANPTIFIVNSSTTASGYFYMWGLQFEGLSYATSYIPTNGGTVTRDGETCTGAGEAIDFNSEEGVLYAEIAALADNQTYRTISLNDGTNNECVRLRFNTSSNIINGLVRDGGSGIAQTSYQVSDIKQFHKAAFKYKSGDCQLWIDGVQRATSTDTFTLSTQTQLNFNQGTSSDIFYGKCKAIRVYKDASIDLATLTS